MSQNESNRRTASRVGLHATIMQNSILYYLSAKCSVAGYRNNLDKAQSMHSFESVGSKLSYMSNYEMYVREMLHTS